MRILIDTNVLILREDPIIISKDLQRLLKILSENNHTILVHPGSSIDINHDRDSKRKEVMFSKIGSYPKLESPPVPDANFANIIHGIMDLSKITVDDSLLYTVYRNAVDILITEDRGIHKNALKIDLEDRVMDIATALSYFENIHTIKPISHVIIREEPVHNVNINDSIFRSLKDEYGPKFLDWFEKISREGRKCWLYKPNGEVKAILIYKKEEELIELKQPTPPMPKLARLKLATFKVEASGFRIGELLLKLAIQYCINNEIDEMYLTHFVKENDSLVRLIEEFGFYYVGNKENGEAVLIKKLIPNISSINAISPIEMSKKYYPSFKDGYNITKFIVPIKPKYHNLLFQDYQKRQMEITEYINVNPQGNTIKKAYLTHSKLKKIRPGDIVLFYRSTDKKELTSLGIVENIYYSIADPEKIWKLVGRNRSVYTLEEIKDMCKKPVTVIIFKHHFNFSRPLSLEELKNNGILKAQPQSIVTIDNERYIRLKSIGGIDGRFTFG